ncbi:MAG TPA: hypothetical protein IAA58_10730 [Candidatus Gallacutalibacter stercoravium]|nr:hypothetical protein [Candidatus Gallacutalibacter stercoravium]
MLCRFQNEQIKAFWNYAVLTIQLSRHGDKDTLCKTLYGPVIAQVPNIEGVLTAGRDLRWLKEKGQWLRNFIRFHCSRKIYVSKALKLTQPKQYQSLRRRYYFDGALRLLIGFLFTAAGLLLLAFALWSLYQIGLTLYYFATLHIQYFSTHFLP